MSKTLKQKAKHGALWGAIERFSTQGVQFVIGVILARLLTPEDYGLVGMLAIFIAIAQTFIEGGFSQALVQKKGRDELDYSTTFYFNIGVALFFYAILFVASPAIAAFYDEPLLVDLTRVIGLTIIINAFSVVQRAKFTAAVDFKSQTKASLISALISGAIGLWMAYEGYGVWSLVALKLIAFSINTLVLWYMSHWIPQLNFSIERFKRLFSFGSKLLFSNLLNTVFANIYSLVIGKIFSGATLGNFTRARQFSELPSQNITGIIQRVTFPVLSEIQDDNMRLQSAYKQIIRMAAILIFPLMMGLAALAKPLVLYVLTDKWNEVIWMLQLLCFAMMWYPIHAINLNVINVKGRSDIFLKLEIIKKIIVTVALIVTIPLGLEAMLVGQIATSYIALIINLYYTEHIINYGFWQQMRDLFPILILSFVMGAIVYGTSLLVSHCLLQLIVGTLVGAVFFVGIAWSFNIGNIREIKAFFKR